MSDLQSCGVTHSLHTRHHPLVTTSFLSKKRAEPPSSHPRWGSRGQQGRQVGISEGRGQKAAGQLCPCPPPRQPSLTSLCTGESAWPHCSTTGPPPLHTWDMHPCDPEAKDHWETEPLPLAGETPKTPGCQSTYVFISAPVETSFLFVFYQTGKF